MPMHQACMDFYQPFLSPDDAAAAKLHKLVPSKSWRSVFAAHVIRLCVVFYLIFFTCKYNLIYLKDSREAVD